MKKQFLLYGSFLCSALIFADLGAMGLKDMITNARQQHQNDPNQLHDTIMVYILGAKGVPGKLEKFNSSASNAVLIQEVLDLPSDDRKMIVSLLRNYAATPFMYTKPLMIGLTADYIVDIKNQPAGSALLRSCFFEPSESPIALPAPGKPAIERLLEQLAKREAETSSAQKNSPGGGGGGGGGRGSCSDRDEEPNEGPPAKSVEHFGNYLRLLCTSGGKIPLYTMNSFDYMANSIFCALENFGWEHRTGDEQNRLINITMRLTTDWTNHTIATNIRKQALSRPDWGQGIILDILKTLTHTPRASKALAEYKVFNYH